MNNEVKNEPILKVFSGQCCLCDVGIDVKHNDAKGRPIHTGDIVTIYSGLYVGTDDETWSQHTSLTAVVADQYQSYSDGTIRLRNEAPTPFVMGIKDCGFSDPEWQIHILKKFDQVIDGEHWTDYGFRYGYNDTADNAMLAQRAKGE